MLRHRSRVTTALAVLIGATSVPDPAIAQDMITLEGRVVDGSGAALPGAVVSVVDLATGTRRTTRTRAAGHFRMIAMNPGAYEIVVHAEGHAPRRRVTELVIGQQGMLQFDLERETIELDPLRVAAVRPPFSEIARSSVSTAVLEQEIRELPLSTRNAMDLAGLTPGIRSFRPLGGQSLPAAGALRGERFINLYVDGVQLKNLYDGNLVGFPHLGSPLPADGLKEFRVYLQPYDPAYSHGAAYVINAITHRGTNETLGNAFGFLQHRSFVAGNDFLSRQPNFTDADFKRQQVGLTLRGPVVRDRLFYATSYELQNTINYISVVPGRPAYDPGIWDAYAGVFATPTRNHTGTARLTYATGEAHTLEAIGSVRRLSGQLQFGNAAARESAVADEHTVHTLNLRHRWLSSARFANELSVQFVGWSNNGSALQPQSMRSYPGLQIGVPAADFMIRERHWRFVNRATVAIDEWQGTHLLNAGVEVARVTIDNFFPIWQNGHFIFPTDSSTLPRAARIAMGWRDPHSDRDAWSNASGWVVGLHIGDEWRPISSLTVNAGVRWDAELGLLNNDIALPWAADSELAAIPELRPYLRRSSRRADLNNFSPRFSLSWDPSGDGRLSLRGGAGIVHDRIPSFIAFQEQADVRWRTYDLVAPGTSDPDVLRQRVLDSPSSPPSLRLVANDMNAPESRQWSIGAGVAIRPALALNVDYTEQHIRTLFAQLDLNWVDVSSGSPQRVLTPNYGAIVVWDDFARARYRALLSRLTWQPQPDVRLSLAYTLGDAKAHWDGANRAVPAAAAGQYYAMQRVSGDERHRLVLSAIAPSAFGTKLSLIATVASPRPYPALTGQDLNANSFIFDDWIGEKRYLVPRSTWGNWYRVVDLRVARDLTVSRRTRVSGIVEVFNLFNAENYSSFHGQQKTATGADFLSFRQPTGVFGTRQLQLGARVTFQ
jgi:hypothetical protein